MAAITICSDFGAQKNKVSHWFPLFPHLFALVAFTGEWNLETKMQALRVLFVTGVSLLQALSAERARKYVYPCHLLSLNLFMAFFAFHYQTLGAEENIGARTILNYLYARKQFAMEKKEFQQLFVACTTGVGLLDKIQVPQLKWHFG